jgi:transcriptional regulator with AAA-type ATPase domain
LARAIHNARIDSQSNDASTASGSLSSDAEPNDDNAKLLIPLDARVADAELVQSTFASLFANHDSIQKTTWGRLLLLEADALDAASQNELSGLLRLRDFDVNISSTATRSLVGLAEKGKYDKTLASMLATIEIEIPPLQQRVEDIPVLAQLFLEQYNARGGRQLTGITPAAMDCLLQYSWPGNVDELSAMVVVAAEQTDGLQIDVDDLPKKIHLALAADAFPAVEQKSIDLDDYLKQIEMELIERALKQAKGNKTKAAELLQINRARLIRRLENQDNHEDVDFSESE